MKKSKHTEEQIIGVLKQVEAGRMVKEVARELGVSEATIAVVHFYPFENKSTCWSC